MTTAAHADAAVAEMVAAAPHARIQVHAHPYGLALDMIFLPTEHRRAGEGTAALKALTAYVDRNGLTLSLTPDDVWGTPTRVLHRIYLAHGFRLNKGARRDYRIRDSMRREPAPA